MKEKQSMQNRTLKERQELETHDRLRYDLGEKEKDYLKAQIRMELFLTRNAVKEKTINFI